MKKFVNYKSNLAVLSRAGEQDLTNEFIIGGIIVKFSLQFELGWKVLKELLRYEGVAVAATGRFSPGNSQSCIQVLPLYG